MEFVGIEKQLFEELVRKFEYFEHRVMEVCNRENEPCLFLKSITRYSISRKMCRVSSRKLRTEEKRHFTEAVIYSRNNNH